MHLSVLYSNDKMSIPGGAIVIFFPKFDPPFFIIHIYRRYRDYTVMICRSIVFDIIITITSGTDTATFFDSARLIANSTVGFWGLLTFGPNIYL